MLRNQFLYNFVVHKLHLKKVVMEVETDTY